MNTCKRCGDELLHLLQDTYCANKCSQEDTPFTNNPNPALEINLSPSPKIKFSIGPYDAAEAANERAILNEKAHYLIRSIKNNKSQYSENLKKLFHLLPAASSIECKDGRVFLVLHRGCGLNDLPVSIVHHCYRITVNTLTLGEIVLKSHKEVT